MSNEIKVVTGSSAQLQHSVYEAGKSKTTCLGIALELIKTAATSNPHPSFTAKMVLENLEKLTNEIHRVAKIAATEDEK